ncbi:MAG TPA: right-handed parallel beta-helix repeat-containing protein [Armatimonadota bacterium]
MSDNGRGLFSSYSSPTLVSNVFWNNHLGADHGAGLYLRGGSPQVINNTIIGNVNRSDYQGAGVYTDGNPTVLFVNNILAFNVSGFYRGDGSITFRNNDAYGNFVYDYGNVADPTGTNGNVRVNPAVADVKRGNAHIQATSPLLNNGDDSAVAAGQTDFDGQPRVQGAHVDIGADESDGIASYTALPVVVRVSPSGDDANDGSDWTKAKKTIQAALDAAPGGGEVWVAAGAYTGGVRLNANVALYGGFAGTETAREQRDWTTHVASIDGVGGVTVYISPMTLSTGVLDGFVIRNGNTGIQCVGSSPVLRNNSVTANSTGIVLNTASPLIDGNAIFANGREGIVGDGSPTVTNNVVNANNPANNSLHGINVTGAPPTIANNKVTNNGGRGISVSPGPTVFSENRVSGNFLEGIAYGGAAGSIINNRVSNNRNAGIYVNGGGPAVSGNTVTGNGTGISADSGSTSVITGNTMSGNLGRGFAADATAVTVTNNTIADNLGGGVNLGGGFPTLLNNVIRGNAITNDVGAGILLRAGAALVANNTIVNNTTNYNGGGIYFRDSAYPTVSNNIIAFNSSGLYRESGGTTLKSNDVYGNADYDYANMPDATGASGNLKADPRLADLRNNNVHIQPDSPARNAGDDAVVSAGETDMDGQARVQGSHVDIGADESDGTTFTPARAVVFVSSTGRDSNDGTTWERAKGTVRNAIGAANGGEEVWVAKGVYKERIALKSGVTLLGGFAGAETDKSQRDYAANPTILDGSGGGSVVTIPLGTAMTATVDGFTIRNSGNAGSGVLFSGGSATFRNNIVTGNGNGVYNDGGSPKILNNLIYGNLRGVYSQFGSPLFANNVVRNNRYATDHGIGFYLRGGAPTLQNNTIAANVHNTNYAGAGLYAMAGSVVTMVNNIVAYNVSGVYKESDCTISLRGNCFFYNQSYDYGNMASATGTNGNIRQDPQFADLASGDVHINVSSACRNAGDSTAVTAGQLDLDGQPRIQDGVVDIGADESNGTLYNRPPVVIRVKPAGDDSADGASWATARKTVQAAIEACMGNGQVWVAAGTYNEQLTLKPNVAVYGGFADDVNELSGRNPMVNVTILNGVGGTTVFVPGATLGTTTLDGFTVTNGGSYDIFVDGASPVLRNNTLSAASYGIYCQSGGAPVIQSSVFTANGNGVWNRDNTSPQITGNAFFGNGRAIYMNGGAPLIANNVIRNNTLSADYGAGLYVDGGTPTVANNTIVGNLNRPDYAGAAVWVNNASANVTLVNNIVAFNTSGVYVNGGGVTFRNNDFYGNQMYDYGNVADPTGAGGNIKADPKLADVPRADLHIQPDSPARDAGDDSAVASGDKDMDGQDRVQGPHVDMGADESDDTAYTVAPLVVRVNAASGDDANDGSDWAKAKKTVQAAIASEPGGGDVWVAAGTYNERILIASDIRLYGGFTGTETDRASRNASANLTILDGQYAGGTQVVRIPSGAQRVIFDGFTVRNSQYEGIYISGSSPTIAHNVVTGTSYRGIYVENGGAPLIKDNLITANGNDGGGGGIYLNRSNAVVSGNVITGNHSNYGGAISVDTASPVIVNNVMRDNTASHSGGAAFISGGSASVRNNILFHNRSVYYGGAIRLDAGSPVLANNSIVGNTHDNQGYTGGAVWFYSGTNATLVNNVIAFNDSGLSRDSGTITLRNNDVYGNSSYDYANLTDATGADGNLRVDPVFADVRAGDLHIQNTSPLRNAGDNSAVAAGDVDMDGQIRIQNGSVDIGADESNGVVVNPPSVRVYVRSDGDDANTGASWAAAKKTVQAGIDSALAGGEVWVAAGTYSGAFLVRSGILMYGGFAGTETQLSARNVAANGTILDANGSGNAVTVPSGSRSVTIDGFTIRGAQGQGIYVNGSSPTIRNNTITGNKDRGIYIDSGGAPAILNNLIAANGAGNTGGGIMVRQASSPVVTGNTIADNRSDYGAGLCSLEGSSPVVTSNVFIRNVSTYHGGALRLDNGNAIVNGNTIALNSTSSSSYVGGGIWLNGVTLTLANNIIAFNSSGIYNSGGAFGVRNNDLYGNTEYDYGNLTDLTGSAGNVRVDPKLADLPRGNVHIIPTSPLRDAGEDSVVQIGDVDLDGQARKQGAHVDIGADESNGAAYIVPAFVVRVKTDGDDSADGLTWATAKKTVQAAVNVAAGGEVWVAKGTYQERVTLKANTALYGGFAGAETVRASRDVAANASIIDANGSGSAVYIPPSDPGTTILDGLTLQGGSTDYGGGVRINGSSAIVHNNAITGNKAQSGAGIAVLGGASPTITGNVITANTFANSAYYGYGGGVYCDSGTIPTISGNTISKNVSNGSQVFGAGVYCGSGSFPVISGNTFDSNTANGGVYGYGGAVFCAVNSAPSIAGNVMTGNSATGGASNSTAGWGGAVFNDDYSFPAITGNTMSGNSANSGGGAVYADTESAGLIAGNVITGNTAPYGGAVGLYQSLPIITGNTISANAATTGGAVNAYQAAALISDNLIVNNTATNAAAMVFDASTPVISNNTIAANVGTNGASVTFTGSSVLMANNIVAYNTLGIGRDASAVLSFYNNDVFSNTTNYIGQLDVSGTAGNISADPRFVNRAGNDYHLAAGSPGLDAGDDSVPQPGETDRDGNARALGAHVDMGAYETRPAGYLTRTDVIRALRGSGGLVRTGAEDAILAGQAPNVNVLNLLDAVRAARKAAGLDKNP